MLHGKVLIVSTYKTSVSTIISFILFYIKKYTNALWKKDIR